MKNIYYVLDDNTVVDFTEKSTAFLYGTIPKEMTIEELKKILEFDNHIYTFENNVLTSVAKQQKNDDILKLKQENKLLHEQVKVLTEQGEMRDTLIAEMAGLVYG